MTVNECFEGVVGSLGNNPTQDQEQLIQLLANYLSDDNRKDVFIIRGYAGTGKTTVVGATVKYLKSQKTRVVLLAPTGRAAKVMSSYSGVSAFTIHKYIYQVGESEFSGVQFFRKTNKHKNTVFIVDESSMISEKSDGYNNILHDLVEFVNESENNRLIFVGDIAQLPPVGSDLSPALIPRYFKDLYGFRIGGFELKEVVRQREQSGILELATRLRTVLKEGGDVNLDINSPDVSFISGAEFPDEMESSLSNYGEEGVVVLTRSNKSANLFNQQIRARILYREERVEGGDMMMVVKNNYHWLESDFIANGESIQIQRIGRYETIGEYNFVEATIEFVDNPNQKPLDVTLLLNAIDVETSSIPNEHFRGLYELVEENYMHIENVKSRRFALKKDPYINALQVKFAYAITGHKAQGGQWPHVYIDMSFLYYTEWDFDVIRWLYTAITRATEKLYFINLPPELLEE